MFMQKTILYTQYAVSYEGNGDEIAKVSSTIALSVMIFTTLLMLVVLINKIKEIRKTRKNQMIVEGVRKNRNCKFG